MCYNLQNLVCKLSCAVCASVFFKKFIVKHSYSEGHFNIVFLV